MATDQHQPPDTAPVGNNPAATSPEEPPCSPAQSDRTVIATMKDTVPLHDPVPCTGIAMFSTEIGKRAPRKVPSLPLRPVIVRSNIVQSVVAFARYWLGRFPMQYLCVFDNCGWTVHDLWDAEDIHVESLAFCQEALGFIGRDNYYRARVYAMEWSRLHQDRLIIIQGQMDGFYDPQDPLAIVDKIFVNGETQFHPRTFLWHVAHIIRAAMVEAARMKMIINHTGIVQQGTPMRIHRAIGANGSTTRAESLPAQRTVIDSPTVKGSYASSHLSDNIEKVEPLVQAPKMHNRGIRHTGSNEMKRKPSHGPPRQGEYQYDAVGPMGMVAPGPHATSSNTSQHDLIIPQGKLLHNGPDIYGRSMQPTGWVEKTYRGVSGSMHRHGPVSLPTMPPPYFNAFSMAAGQPAENPPHMIPPFNPGHPLASPPMPDVQPMHPSLMQHGGLPHPMSAPVPSTMNPYRRYLSDGQDPPGLIADVTNMPYPVEMPIPNTERRRSGVRNNKQYHGHGGALFDPYDGTRPSFNSPAVPYSAKKHHQNGFQNQSGRPRKHSIPFGYPGPVQYGLDRSGNTYDVNFGFPSSRRHSTEDDPEVTQDVEKGCSSHWIGPRNETVKEVFIGDLPEDIQIPEIEILFKRRIGITPASVAIPSPPLHRYHCRRHAFVTFKDVSEAKQAIAIVEPLLRETQITITVPRRFYQKPCPLTSTQPPDTVLRNEHFRNGRRAERQKAQGATNMLLPGPDQKAAKATSAATENTTYSPQDARSDLQTRPGHVRQAISSSTGSPNTQKPGSKKHQESPTKPSKEKPASSSSFNVKHARDRTQTTSHDSAPVKQAITSKSHPSGSEVNVQEPEHNSACSESCEVTEVPQEKPPVLKLNIAQDTGMAKVKSSEAQNDGVVQHSGGKREEAGITLDMDPETNAVSALAMGPIITEHISPTEAPVPEAHDGTTGSLTENEKSPSTEEPFLGNEVNNNIRPSSVREPQPIPLVVVPNLAVRFNDIPVNNGGPTSASTDGFLSPKVSSKCVRTGTSPIGSCDNESKAMSVVPNENTPLQPSVEEPERAESTPSVEATKKDTAPQIQSLSPFARPSKNQLKKEKEQKKKALRKEKAEQAEKLRATRTAASGKSNGGSAAKPRVEDKNGETNERSQPVAGGKTKVNHEPGNHGKQKGATVSSLPHEIDSETPKATVNFSRLTDSSEHALSPLDAASQSSRVSVPGSTIDNEMNRNEISSSPSAVTIDFAAISAEVDTPSPISTTLTPAVSDLGQLHVPKSSAPSPETNERVSDKESYHTENPLFVAPIISAVDSNHIDSYSSREEAEEARCPNVSLGHNCSVAVHTSVSSFAVPRAPPFFTQIDDSASDAYSIETDEICTPPRTSSRNKKKVDNKKTARNNARKKKKTAKLQQADKTTEIAVVDKPTKISAANEPIREDEPFSSQMMHIDAVRSGANVESQDLRENHFEYARNLMKEYGDELGWKLEEVSKVPKPSGEELDTEALRRHEAAQIQVAEIWVRESCAHEKLNDLDGFWSKEEMINRGALEE